MALSKVKMTILTALFLLAVAALIFFAMRKPAPPPPPASPPPSSFANLSESTIPGRYKWIESGQESFIELLNDHTFINKDGTIFPMYRWELTPQGLSLRWSASSQIFTNVEAPGVYTRISSKGLPVRMEKQPASDGSEWAPSARPGLTASLLSNNIVASTLLNPDETNGLAVVNLGGDGRIIPTMLGDVDCYLLVRKPNRPEAYLYLRISPELKEPPFTNAALIVEYFDARPADLRTGFITLQYDAPPEAYTRLTQRVRLTGTEKWKEVIFFVVAPMFHNRMNDGGDIRLCTANHELGVRSIKLAKNIP